MKYFSMIAVFAFVLTACGSESDDSATADKPKRPMNEYFVWSDPGIASGNFDADYADCKAQIDKDPAIVSETPELVVLATYIKCMKPKGWNFVDPDAPQP